MCFKLKALGALAAVAVVVLVSCGATLKRYSNRYFGLLLECSADWRVYPASEKNFALADKENDTMNFSRMDAEEDEFGDVRVPLAYVQSGAEGESAFISAFIPQRAFAGLKELFDGYYRSADFSGYTAKLKSEGTKTFNKVEYYKAAYEFTREGAAAIGYDLYISRADGDNEYIIIEARYDKKNERFSGDLMKRIMRFAE